MPDYTNLNDNAAGLEFSPAFAAYTGVRLWYDDENAYFAGDETGRVMEADCPWATQEMANKMLRTISGFVYQPWEATDALLDPAAELGDGAAVGGIYGPLASITTTFDALCASDIGAPEDEEVDHEYPYLSKTRRELDRKLTLGASYYGTRITRARGLEITKTEADGTESAKVVLNSDQLAFYDADGSEALYFDPVSGRYKFNGILDVAGNFLVDKDGNVTINGNINLSGGTISWGNNKPSGGISSSQAKTLINEALVSSPNIAGGRFYSLPSNVEDPGPITKDVGGTWLKIGSDGGPGGGEGLVLQSWGFITKPIFGVYNGDGDYTSFSAKGHSFLNVDAGHGSVEPLGRWNFDSGDCTLVTDWLYSDSFLSIDPEDELILRAFGGKIAVRFEDNDGEYRIKIWLAKDDMGVGKTWILDKDGLHT